MKPVYNNVILIGFMGCGKTSVGRILAKNLFKTFVDVDSVVEKKEGLSINEIFKDKGEEYFREVERKCLHEITQKTGQVISTGGGLPIFGPIPENSLVVYIEADFDVIIGRLSKKEHSKRPLLQNEPKARSLFDERIDTYKELATFRVDANQSIPTFIHGITDFILDQRVL